FSLCYRSENRALILPFVREIFADVEKSLSFQRAATLLKSRAGRIRLSGLIPSAKAAHLPMLHRAAEKPILFVVANNRVADDYLPLIQSFCELSAAADTAGVVKLPAYDVLP